MAIWKTPAPGVVVLPNWDNVNQYEKERAVLLAESGYVAFAADIYGADLQEGLSDDVRSEQYSTYVNDMDLYVARMQRAVEQLQQVPEVDPNNIAIIGYCFGGTGAIQYAFSGRDDVKAVVPVHGGLNDLPDITAPIAPYTLILSGGDDAAHGNQTILEEALNMGNATWEITRYAFVEHGFTGWEDSRYNLNADARSWESSMTIFEHLMPTPEMVSSDEAGNDMGDDTGDDMGDDTGDDTGDASGDTDEAGDDMGEDTDETGDDTDETGDDTDESSVRKGAVVYD